MFQTTVGHQLERLHEAGDEDGFAYLVTTTFADLVSAMAEAGWDESQIQDELDNAIANYEPDED